MPCAVKSGEAGRKRDQTPGNARAGEQKACQTEQNAVAQQRAPASQKKAGGPPLRQESGCPIFLHAIHLIVSVLYMYHLSTEHWGKSVEKPLFARKLQRNL